MRALGRIFTGLMLALSAGQVATADCTEDEVELRGDWGSARFRVELADTAAERAEGLMKRETLPRMAGMLFLYDTPQPVSFWMRNTLIPLDMLFIDARGSVTRVHREAIPLDETAIPGGSGILAVLEVNGGLTESFGIGPGSQVRHPAFRGNDPVWPCD